MGNNLGWKTIITNHDKRNIKPLKKSQYGSAFTKLCRICGKPLHGGSNLCGSCEQFIKMQNSTERQGTK